MRSTCWLGRTDSAAARCTLSRSPFRSTRRTSPSWPGTWGASIGLTYTGALPAYSARSRTMPLWLPQPPTSPRRRPDSARGPRTVQEERGRLARPGGLGARLPDRCPADRSSPDAPERGASATNRRGGDGRVEELPGANFREILLRLRTRDLLAPAEYKQPQIEELSAYDAAVLIRRDGSDASYLLTWSHGYNTGKLGVDMNKRPATRGGLRELGRAICAAASREPDKPLLELLGTLPWTATAEGTDGVHWHVTAARPSRTHPEGRGRWYADGTVAARLSFRSARLRGRRVWTHSGDPAAHA
jgi:hypothetical protein